MSRADERLPLRHAVVLGIVQGPAELLPVSSSAHTSLIPWLARWPYAQLDAAQRKSFELALHCSAACALALLARRPLARRLARVDRSQGAVLGLSLLPPALAGTALRRQIEKRLGGPRASAAGLLAGALAMALADARPAVRSCEQARPLDGLALGMAQALALAPGVSRSGAALTAARARRFTRPAAHALSGSVALPLIIGAGALEGVRVARGRTPPGPRAAIAAGGAAAFLSTLASSALLRRVPLGRRALLACALYRCALAAAVAMRLRRAQ